MKNLFSQNGPEFHDKGKEGMNALLNTDLSDYFAKSPDFLEREVLASLVASESFFARCADPLKEYKHLVSGSGRFSNFLRNQLFEAICTVRNSNSGEDGFGEFPIPREILETFVSSREGCEDLFIADEQEITELLDSIYETIFPALPKFIEGEIFTRWLEHGAASRISKDTFTSDHEVPIEALKARLETFVALGKYQESSVVSFEDALVDEIDHAERFSTDLFDLDKALGGGFRRGESTLVAAVTGGGKTVMATQLAAKFALDGHKVLLATTEESPRELVPRMLSNHLNVRFHEFQKGSCGDNVIPEWLENSPPHASALRDLRSQFSENMKFLDWSAGKGKSVEANLNAEIDNLLGRSDSPFAPDILIFDWIGGALSKDLNKDLRQIYLDAANHLHDFAKKRDVCTVMFAQLNKRQATGSRCDSTMLAECKAMPDQATNAVYISSKRAEGGGDEAYATYETVQTVNVDKARKGPGGCFKVMCDFQYQRFRQFKSTTFQARECAFRDPNKLLGS